NIDDATLNAIKDGGFKRVVVVGGTAAVTSAAQAKLEQAGAQVVRLAGDTALDTSGAIAAWEVGEGMGVSHLSVATSDGYWDALTGAAVCGKNSSVLVLVGKDGAKDPWRAYDSASQLGKIEHGHVLGGTAAVSSAAWKHFTGTDEE
ncbi:MAG: cell wall-binding repeat-containing protein, partial [Atopobiaceae bacterium]|nr:cell wall-binding repeat-containing protein [Atopobiaceae bacterium]